MTYNRKILFDEVRVKPFGGLKPNQVSGTELILAEAERRNFDDRWTAYCLATAYHETAHTMQAIEEYGKGKGRKYGVPINGHVYFGRGLVQLTWDYNYKAMGEILGVDFLGKPELALDPAIAVKIMFEGMVRGTFTGKKLSQYFNDKKDDPKEARRIINGVDRADLIAGYYQSFLAALRKSKEVSTAQSPTTGSISGVIGQILSSMFGGKNVAKN